MSCCTKYCAFFQHFIIIEKTSTIGHQGGAHPYRKRAWKNNATDKTALKTKRELKNKINHPLYRPSIYIHMQVFTIPKVYTLCQFSLNIILWLSSVMFKSSPALPATVKSGLDGLFSWPQKCRSTILTRCSQQTFHSEILDCSYCTEDCQMLLEKIRPMLIRIIQQTWLGGVSRFTPCRYDH